MVSDHHTLHGPVSRPHLFQVIEFADLGAEDMDDYVARIDQHPVALRRAFDTRFAEACFLQFGLTTPDASCEGRRCAESVCNRRNESSASPHQSTGARSRIDEGD